MATLKSTQLLSNLDSEVKADSQVDPSSQINIDYQVKPTQTKAQLEAQKEVKVNVWR